MRLKSIPTLVLICFTLPLISRAGVTASVDPVGVLNTLNKMGVKEGKKVSGEYSKNEMMVDKLEGTIMVQSPDDPKPVALQTFSTVEKGDTLTVYDKSWVILKNHKGDRIGIDSGTVLVIDEFFIEGPDRQVRLLLQKGTLHLKTNGSDSRQSFFEVNTGNVVTSINEVQANINYQGDKNLMKVQYFNGKLTVIDKDKELKFKDEYVEYSWENGKMVEEASVPVDELDKVNYNRFFDGEDPLENPDNNILMGENTNPNSRSVTLFGNSRKNKYNKVGVAAGAMADVAQAAIVEDALAAKTSPEAVQAREAYTKGKDSYNQGRFSEARDYWEEALTLKPKYKEVMARLKQLSQTHPELKIDDLEWRKGQVVPRSR